MKFIGIFLMLLLGLTFKTSELTCYEIDKPIIISESNKTFNFQNIPIRLANHANCPMIIIGSIEENPTYFVENIIIENLILDGNKANQDYEIWHNRPNYIRNNGISVRHCKNIIIRNCSIKNSRSGNIVIEKECENILIENCHLSNAYFDGIAGYISKNCIIKNNIIENNVYAGMSFDLQFNDNIISGNTIIGNDLGIFLRHCDNNLIFGNVLNNKHFDLYFNQIDHDMTTIPKSNSLYNNKTNKDFINQL